MICLLYGYVVICLLYGYVVMFVLWIRGDMFVAWILGYIQIRPLCTINWPYLRSNGIKLPRSLINGIYVLIIN